MSFIQGRMYDGRVSSNNDGSGFMRNMIQLDRDEHNKKMDKKQLRMKKKQQEIQNNMQADETDYQRNVVDPVELGYKKSLTARNRAYADWRPNAGSDKPSVSEQISPFQNTAKSYLNAAKALVDPITGQPYEGKEKEYGELMQKGKQYLDKIDTILNDRRMLSNSGGDTAPTRDSLLSGNYKQKGFMSGVTGKGPIDAVNARSYLIKAKNDPVKAKELARQDGWIVD